MPHRNRSAVPAVATVAALAAVLLLPGGTAHGGGGDAARRSHRRDYVRTRVLVGTAVPRSAPLTTRAAPAGLTLEPTFESSILDDPRGSDVVATIRSVLARYAAAFSDPVTVRLTFGRTSSGLGSSSTQIVDVSYTDFRAALAAHATTPLDDAALAQLPASAWNPANGDHRIELTTALARALGFSADPAQGEPDSRIRLNTGLMNLTPADTDPQKYALSAVVAHEIDEALGMGSDLDVGTAGPVRPEDLLRYDETPAGARSHTRDPAARAYLSIDGATKLVRFNQDASGDFGDWDSDPSQTPQVQDAFGTPGSAPVPNLEFRVLDVIGWTRADGAVPNHAPTLTAGLDAAPRPSQTGTPTNFTLAAEDHDGDLLSTFWDFGDGEYGVGDAATHTYTTTGNFLCTATVTDGFGGAATDSVTVAVDRGTVASTCIRHTFRLDFRHGRDRIDVIFRNAAIGAAPDGSVVRLVIGDVAAGGGTVVDAGVLFGGRAAGSMGRFVVNARKGTVRYVATRAALQTALAPYGATNANVPKTPLVVPVSFQVGDTVYGASVTFRYVSHASKAGVAR